MQLHLYTKNLRVLSSPWAFAEGVVMMGSVLGIRPVIGMKINNQELAALIKERAYCTQSLSCRLLNVLELSRLPKITQRQCTVSAHRKGCSKRWTYLTRFQGEGSQLLCPSTELNSVTFH